MSDNSERRLQRILHSYGWYSQRAPSSGYGLKMEDGDHMPHPDVVAIRGVPAAGSDVLIFEDKHVESYPEYIQPDQYEALTTVAQRTNAYPVIAVQIKGTRYPHDFIPLPIDNRTDTGNYVVNLATDTITADELLSDEPNRPYVDIDNL